MSRSVLFQGTDTSDEPQLWVTNGTVAGTHEVTGIAGANAGGLDPMYFAVLDGVAFFNGTDAAGNFGLWVTNGAASGTGEITGIAGASSSGLDPRYLDAYDGMLLFRGNSGVPGNYIGSLWVSNGTAAGTHVLNVANAYAGGLLPSNPDFTNFAGQVLFNGRDAANNVGLWVTNGTAAGTFELAPISGAFTVGSPGSDVQPQSMTVLGNGVLFDGADTQDTEGSLWVTNGTAAGTYEVGGLGNGDIAGSPDGDANNLPIGIQPQDLTTYGAEVVFAGYDNTLQPNLYYAHTDALWVTNGTAAGTTEIGGLGNAGIVGANSAQNGGLFWAGSIAYPDFTVYDGKVLFQALDSSNQDGLWVTDGTAAGTHEITGIGGGFHLIDSANPDFTVFNGVVLFDAYDSNNFAGLWVTNGTAAGTHELTGIANAAGIFTPEDFTALPSAHSDFNGDGKSDILFLNPNGALAMWEISNTQIIGGGVFETLSAGWTVSGIGDFNGDGKSDILLSTGAGAVSIWEMNGTSVIGGGGVGSLGSGWNIAGVGDFNGDGYADILFQNSSGALGMWAMNGTSIIGGSGDFQSLGANSGWVVAGTGDFNGDGKSDILLQNTNGAVAMWEMNGVNIIGGGVFENLGAGSGWNVVGVGDFNDDGKSDVLLENTNGALAMWLMNGASVVGGGVFQNLGAGSGWSVAGVGDYNGDGFSDILLHNTSGATQIWDMDGATVTGGGPAGSIPSPWLIKRG